ncbi:MAG: hypothetical protein QXP36_04635 [Conexivisphaerales archaeon]
MEIRVVLKENCNDSEVKKALQEFFGVVSFEQHPSGYLFFHPVAKVSYRASISFLKSVVKISDSVKMFVVLDKNKYEVIKK